MLGAEESDDEVWDEGGTLFVPATNLQSESIPFSPLLPSEEPSVDGKEEEWEDPETSDQKLFTSSASLPLAGNSPLWHGVELQERIRLNDRLVAHKKLRKQKEKILVVAEKERGKKNDFVESNKYTNGRPWIDIFDKKSPNKLLRPVLGGVKSYYVNAGKKKRRRNRRSQLQTAEIFQMGIPMETIYSRGFAFANRKKIIVSVKMNYLLVDMYKRNTISTPTPSMAHASMEECGDNELEEHDKVEAGMTVEAFDCDELCKSTHFIPWKHLLAMLIVCGRTNLAMRCQKSLKKRDSNMYERQVQNLTVAAYLVGILAIDINNNYINIRPDVQRAMQECLFNVKLSTSPVKKRKHKRPVNRLLRFSSSDKKVSTIKRRNGDFDWYNVNSRIEEREKVREVELIEKQGKIINGIEKRFQRIKKKKISTRKQGTDPNKFTKMGSSTKIYRRRTENVRLKPLKTSGMLLPNASGNTHVENRVEKHDTYEFYNSMLDARNILLSNDGNVKEEEGTYREGSPKHLSSSTYKPYIEPLQKVNMQNYRDTPDGIYNSFGQKFEKRIVGDKRDNINSSSNFYTSPPVTGSSSRDPSRKKDLTIVDVRWEGPIGIELGHGKKQSGKHVHEKVGGTQIMPALKDIYIVVAINKSNEALQELKIGNRLLYVNDFKIRSGMHFQDVTKRIRESTRPLKLTFSRRVHL